MLILACLIFFLLYLIFIYNKLLRLNLLKKEAWSGIDVQLKQRSDLIPNLVAVVKAYSAHEAETLARIVSERNPQQVAGNLKQLFAIVEKYPDLKANTNFLELQKSLVEIEDQLQYARRYFNGTVRDYNLAVQSFPNNIFAKIINYLPDQFFEVEYVTERSAPDVSFN